MPDARFPAAGSPPGKSSQRADLSPAARNQPIRIGTGQPYGSAKQEEQLQQARRLEDRSGAGPPPSAPGAVGPPAAPPEQATPGPVSGGVSPGLTTHPRDILATIGGHPSNFPDRPVTFGVPMGSPKTTSIHSVLADLEDLMHRSPTVPTTVIDLYQRLRDEAAQAGQPAPGGPPPVGPA
jgi:hypothetical protein